jgi:proline dehydrogenase
VPIRLVKGAYVEEPQIARPRGEPTDLAFLELAHEVHANGAELAIATHDAVLREALLRALPGIGVEMLLGVRSADARAAAGRGLPVRIYVPYGDGWFRYAMRRWAESVGRRGPHAGRDPRRAHRFHHTHRSPLRVRASQGSAPDGAA